MKRIILFIVFIVITVAAKTQCNHPYKSFDQFRNDTTAFLRYNFKTRADCYKGKTVAYVLKDLQLKPKSFMTLSSIKTDRYEGICVYIDNTNSSERISNSKKRNQYIYIYWPNLMSFTEALNLKRTYDSDVWVPKHYDFFKNNIVGEVAYYD